MSRFVGKAAVVLGGSGGIGSAVARDLNPMRKARGGSIVLFGSAAATLGLPNHAAIAAAKAGVVVLDLLSDGAANVTGAVLPVDGGLSAGRPPGA